MKFNSIAMLAAVLLVADSQALSMRGAEVIASVKLDDSTRRSVQRAAAAALSVAVAAKKAEAAESIKRDMSEVKKAEIQETSDSIQEAIEQASRLEEKKAVEKAVAHVEKIRQ